jgi:hypothetical protein
MQSLSTDALLTIFSAMPRDKAALRAAAASTAMYEMFHTHRPGDSGGMGGTDGSGSGSGTVKWSRALLPCGQAVGGWCRWPVQIQSDSEDWRRAVKLVTRAYWAGAADVLTLDGDPTLPHQILIAAKLPIRWLRLRGVKDCALAVFDAVATVPDLEGLEVTFSKSTTDAAEIGAVLAGLKDLVHLEISGMTATAAGGIGLGVALACLPRLTNVALPNNGLGRNLPAAETVGRALAVLNLWRLDLRGNGLGEDSRAVQALALPPTLTELHVGDNPRLQPRCIKQLVRPCPRLGVLGL